MIDLAYSVLYLTSTHAMLRLRECSAPFDLGFEECSTPAMLLGSESLFSRSLNDSVVPFFSFFTPVKDGTDLLSPLVPFALGVSLPGPFPFPLAAILFCLSNLSLSSRFICSSSWKLRKVTSNSNAQMVQFVNKIYIARKNQTMSDKLSYKYMCPGKRSHALFP